MTSTDTTANVTMRRVDVVLVAQVDGVDEAASARLLERLRAATDTLVVDGSHSGSRLTLTVRGEARSLLALVDGRLTDGEKLLGDGTPTVVTADVDHVSSEKAATISNHLLNAAQNKPEESGALDIRTEHDEARSHLTVRLTGSSFATSYLLFLVYLQIDAVAHVSTLDRFFESVPDPQRESVRGALSSAFGANPPSDAQRVTGGASGALTYRLEVGERPYFLRVETRRDATRNPHQYACMRTAAEAGIAPPLRHVDEAAGTVIMDYIPQRPLAEYPGGPAALAGALGDMVRRLQDTSVFPELRDYPAILRFMDFLRSSGRFTPGLLDPHASEFERIAGAYPWQLLARVSSHNDPNPRNIIFDGERLWLVDWETAFRNDPMVDVAILVDSLASSPELQRILLGRWLGREPDHHVQARLTLMRPLTRLYYGLILFALSPVPPEPHADLSALTPPEFGAALARGSFAPGSAAAMIALAKMLLAGFLDATRSPDFETALMVAAEG